MRSTIVGVAMFLGLCGPVAAGVSLEVGLPSVSIGINVPVYPTLVPVPGYPVYYAPQADANLFFYDGLYWVYVQDRWYSSSWYNGPWVGVAALSVPLFILRVPVGFYRRPPVYFAGWNHNAPPRWGDHWGRSWAEHHVGWDRWDRRSVPASAPLPSYQRAYSGSRYPQLAQQQVLRSQHYRYQPSEPMTRQQFAQSVGHGVREATHARAERDSRGAPPSEQQHSRPPHATSDNALARDVHRGPA